MTRRPKVFVTDFITDRLDTEREILGDIADLAALGANHEDELRGHIEDADAIMVYHMLKLSEQTIERLEHCKLIVRCGVGYDNVAGAAARRKGIAVCNVPDYGTEEVADSAIGLTLALTRGITYLNSRLRDGHGPWTYTQVQPVWRCAGGLLASSGWGGSAPPPRCGPRPWAWTCCSTTHTLRTVETNRSACGGSKRSTSCWRSPMCSACTARSRPRPGT